jgi:carboxylesterase
MTTYHLPFTIYLPSLTMTHLMRGAEPYYFRGGPVGALVIHGFTGSPKEMRPLAEALAGAGHTVLGLRLPQHGTFPDDMFRSTALDWQNAALDGYHLLRSHCESVFVIGLSMGGALALWLAAQQPLAGVVAMSTPSQPRLDSMGWQAPYAHWIGRFIRYLPKGPDTVSDPEQQAEHVSYPAYPVRAIAPLRAVIQASIEALPRLTAPALLVHSHADATVAEANLHFIAEHIGATDKEILWLEHSGHVVTEEAEREVVFARVIAFVSAHIRAKA